MKLSMSSRGSWYWMATRKGSEMKGGYGNLLAITVKFSNSWCVEAFAWYCMMALSTACCTARKPSRMYPECGSTGHSSTGCPHTSEKPQHGVLLTQGATCAELYQGLPGERGHRATSPDALSSSSLFLVGGPSPFKAREATSLTLLLPSHLPLTLSSAFLAHYLRTW